VTELWRDEDWTDRARAGAEDDLRILLHIPGIRELLASEVVRTLAQRRRLPAATGARTASAAGASSVTRSR